MRRAWLVLLGICPAASLQAQSNCMASPSTCSTGSFAIQLTIPRVFRLTIEPASTPLTPPAQANYDAGYAASPGPAATIASNAPWTLAISAAAPTWTATSTTTEAARQNKPASDLVWATTAAGPFAALTTAAATIATGNATAATSISLFYRALYNWGVDTPGSYSLQLVFTISAP